MDFPTYLQTVKLRAKPMPSDKQIVHAQIGMLTELGELGDLIKREFVYGKEFDRINLLEEVGDIFWYLVLYCDELQIHMSKLDAILANTKAHLQGTPEADEKMLRVAGQSISTLAADDLLGLGGETLGMVEATVMLLYAFLVKYGFTVEQCLIANDAKLEKRTGKAYNREAILNRDTDAERQILEQHGQAESGQAPS